MNILNQKNVYLGDDSIMDFLNPETNHPVPLVELPASINPYKKDKIRIFAKMMNLVPLLNIKLFPALNMLLEAKKHGELNAKDTIVENSSGNAILALSVVGRLLGLVSFKAFTYHDASFQSINLLRFMGIEPIITEALVNPLPDDPLSGVSKAKKMAEKEGYLNPGQYHNPNNPLAHEKWTGPQIWDQLSGNISVFCSCLGTTGAMLGVARYLKSQSKDILTIGTIKDSPNVPGPRTMARLAEVKFSWQDYVDKVVEVGTEESYRLSLVMCRNGLLVGPSSGLNLAGLLSYFSEADIKVLDGLRNKDGEIMAVFLCYDTPLHQIDNYFKYLDSSFFPKIQNEELLYKNRVK